jgi:branched-chain amino acid transport system permease protein
MIGSYFSDAASQVLFVVMLAMTLNLLLGVAGQLSMATAAFYGLGAYTSGILTATGVNLSGQEPIGPGWPFALGVLGAVAVSALGGLLVALPAGRRVRGDYLILLTLSFHFLFTNAVSSWVSLTGGPNGMVVVPIEIFGWTPATTDDALVLIVIVTILIGLACWRVASSPLGRLLRGLREDEIAVQSLGKRTVWPKMLMFAVTAGAAGGIGALAASYTQFVAPGTYNLDLAILVAACVALGGPGNVVGSAIAAVIIGSIRPVLENVSGLGDAAIPWQAVIYGLILVLTIRFRPQGIVPEGMVTRLRAKRMHSVRDAPSAPDGQALARVEETVAQIELKRNGDTPDGMTVTVRGVSKRFGGLQAAQDVDLDLRPREVVALIGPNGAGKTTVFNLITGTITPDEGSVALNDVSIIGSHPTDVAKAGMVRYFQNIRAFEGMTALENVSIAVPGQTGESLLWAFLRPFHVRAQERRVREAAMESLRAAGVEHLAHLIVKDMAFGEQKLVAFARLLATRAQVLLLDEPTSGVDPKSAQHIIELVKRLAAEGKTICIVEHSLHVVSELADRIVFMDAGRVIAEGTVQEITSKEELVDLYFGT